MAKHAAENAELDTPSLDLSKIELNKDTAISVIRLIVPLLCGIGSTFGWVFDAELLFNILLSIAAVAFFVIAWWKNNNVTTAAQLAQDVLSGLKSGDVDADVVTDVVVEPDIEGPEMTE